MPPRMLRLRCDGASLRVLVVAMALAQIPCATAFAAPTPDCVSWPGEPSPLPTVSEADPFLRAWAGARVGELGRLARALEGIDRAAALRFWQHASCLAPTDEGVRAGIERAAPSAVLRPVPTTRSALASGEPGPSLSVDAALDVALSRAELRSAELRVAAIEPAPEIATREPDVAAEIATREPDAAPPSREQPEPAPAVSAPPPEPVRFEHVDEISELLQQARFRHALERAADARSALQDDRGPAARAQLARVELLAGTAEVALGNPAEAERHFRNALDADPALELDATHPPKVQRLFESARMERP